MCVYTHICTHVYLQDIYIYISSTCPLLMLSTYSQLFFHTQTARHTLFFGNHVPDISLMQPNNNFSIQMKRFHSVTAFSIRFDFEKPQWVPSRQRSIYEAATDSIAAWANLDLPRDPAPSGASLLSTTPPPLLPSQSTLIKAELNSLVSWKGRADSGGQYISVYGNDQACYAIINLHRSLVI